MTIKFDVLNRYTSAVQFTAEIDCDADAPTAVKLGWAVKWALNSGASLVGASLDRASLDGASLVGARLDRASLVDARLDSARLGDQWIIQGATRTDGYKFFLTNFTGEGVRVKAGCRNFSIEEAEAHWHATRGDTPLGRETALIVAGMIEQAKARGLSFDAVE